MIEIRGMHLEELPSVHRMLGRAFPNTPESFFDRQVKNDPVLRPEDTRILLEDGKIRSCVRVYFREIYCQVETIKIGGIGDVGTDPSFQHRGFASRLMEDAVRYMRDNGALLSLLFSRINPFYHSFGYMDLPTLQVEVEPPQHRSKNNYRTADLEKDLGRLQKLYAEFNQNRSGPLARDAHYWKQQMKFPRIDPGLFWMIEDNSTIRCYIRGKIEADCIKIQEWAYRPGEEERVLELIGAMASVANKKKACSRYLSQQEAALFKQWPCDITEDKTSMVRLIQLDKRSTFRNILRPHHFLFWESDRF
jgi:predicted acetyltransferase